MANYKVPQNVEADDKLLGPLSLKQFLFAIAFFGVLYMTYVVFKINPLLVFTTIPVLFITGAFAFWNRKDQPIEVYFSALIRYFTKSHIRVWRSNGEFGLVVIDSPPIISVKYSDERTTKQIESQINQLADVVNSNGWSVKGVGRPGNPSSSLNSDRLVSLDSTPRVGPNKGSEVTELTELPDIHGGVVGVDVIQNQLIQPISQVSPLGAEQTRPRINSVGRGRVTSPQPPAQVNQLVQTPTQTVANSPPANPNINNIKQDVEIDLS